MDEPFTLDPAPAPLPVASVTPSVPAAPTPPQANGKAKKRQMALMAMLPLVMRQQGPTAAAALLAGFQKAAAAEAQGAQQGYEQERQAWTDQRTMANDQIAAQTRQQTLQTQQTAAQTAQQNALRMAWDAFQNQAKEFDSPEQARAAAAGYPNLNPTQVDAYVNATFTPTRQQTRAAEKVLEKVSRTYRPEQLQQLEQSGAKFPGSNGETLTLAEWRQRAGVGAVGPDGTPIAVPGKVESPATAGSFEDFMTASPDRQAQILAGRKKYMQSDDRPLQPAAVVIQTVDASGNPVTKIVPKVAGAEFSTPPTAAQQSAISEQQAGLDMIGDISRLYKPEYVGPVTGRAWKVKMATPGVDVPQDVAAFHASVAGLRNEIIRLMSGAAVSGQEQQRMDEQIPDVTNKPSVFMARLEMTRRNRETLLKRIQARGVAPAAKTSQKIGRFEVTVEP